MRTATHGGGRGGSRRAVFAVLLLVPVLLAFASEAQETGTGEEGPSEYWYAIQTLNRGLGPVPGDLDRDTPQESLANFLDAARDQNWSRAAHFLDLTEIEPSAQAERGPLLARHLAEVIERKLWIDWGNLSDRPDAVVEAAAGGNPMAGQPRRSQRLGILDARGRAVVLRLSRVKPENSEPVWVFSERTVELIPALYRAHGRGWLSEALPEAWDRPLGDLRLRRWELLALPLLLGAAVLLFLAVRGALDRAARMAPSAILRNTAAAASMPLALVVTAVATELVVGWIISFSGPVSEVLQPILLGLILLGVALAALRAVDAVIDRVTRRYVGEIDSAEARDSREFYTSIYAFRRIVVLVAFLVALGLLFSELHVGETLGISLLASAGVLTVLLGIAAQSVLGNIFSSLQIALGKPIRIGDSVIYEDRWAYVESIYYTYVVLRTWDERRLIVPVTHFVSNPFENLTMRNAKMTRTFELVLDHEADAGVVREAFLRIVEEDEDAMEDELTKMLVIDHDRAGQRLLFYATAADPTTSWNMHARLREKTLAWVREHHPEWWPRERELEIGRQRAPDGRAAAGAEPR